MSMAVEGSAEVTNKVTKYASLSEFVALSGGFLYYTGYYINAVFVRNLGIVRSELFKLEYINIGFAFALIIVGFTILPVGIFYFTYKVRRASGLLDYHVGAIGNSLNTTVCLIFPLFLALFITKYEWDMQFPKSVLGMSHFSTIAITALILSLIGMAVLPFFERLINKVHENRKKRALFYFLVEPLRFAIFFISSFLIFQSLNQISWLGNLATKAFYFFLVGSLLVSGLTGAGLWARHIKKVQGKWLIYGFVGFGLASLYYMAVTSYVFGVYNYLPYNRGGRLPLTQAFIKINDEKKITFTSERSENGITYQGPLYIIEENEDSLFVASQGMDKWFDQFVPIHVIRKEEISYIRLERIENGFPRVNETLTNNKAP